MSKATKNPLLALLEDDDFSGYEKDDVDVSALAGASILNLDDTRVSASAALRHKVASDAHTSHHRRSRSSPSSTSSAAPPAQQSRNRRFSRPHRFKCRRPSPDALQLRLRLSLRLWRAPKSTTNRRPRKV
jgi:hypothetical protein